MTLFTECDKCLGKLSKDEQHYVVDGWIYNVKEASRKWHLCLSCFSELEQWIKNK